MLIFEVTKQAKTLVHHVQPLSQAATHRFGLTASLTSPDEPLNYLSIYEQLKDGILPPIQN